MQAEFKRRVFIHFPVRSIGLEGKTSAPFEKKLEISAYKQITILRLAYGIYAFKDHTSRYVSMQTVK
jgi:hypothetical protein